MNNKINAVLAGLKPGATRKIGSWIWTFASRSEDLYFFTRTRAKTHKAGKPVGSRECPQFGMFASELKALNLLDLSQWTPKGASATPCVATTNVAMTIPTTPGGLVKLKSATTARKFSSCKSLVAKLGGITVAKSLGDTITYLESVLNIQRLSGTPPAGEEISLKGS